jgi:hypothetical protein
MMCLSENEGFYGKILGMGEDGMNELARASVFFFMDTLFWSDDGRARRWVLKEGALRCCVKILGGKKTREKELMERVGRCSSRFFSRKRYKNCRETAGLKKSEEYRRKILTIEEEGAIGKALAGRFEDVIFTHLGDLYLRIGTGVSE